MVLGSWSGMRKYLEKDMLAEDMKGRVRYGCTSYKGMDGCHIFEIIIDGRQIKRFSWETVNTWFIEKSLKRDNALTGTAAYWDGFWELMDSVPVSERTEYTDGEFCKALEKYRSQRIGESIVSDDPIVFMFACLDRRTGRRTYPRLAKAAEKHPQWVRDIIDIRFKGEDDHE